VITSSNYLVQLPISIFGFHTTWGAFSFPFIFLATDLTVRIFGAAGATHYPRGDGPGAAHLLRHLALFYMGEWQGFAALTHFNLFVARIAAASFMAYALGQILDVHVFNRLRQNRRWWLAPTASTLFGNVSDTLAFFFIASGAARTRLWRRTGGNRHRRLQLQGADQHCFLPADVRHVVEYAAEKAGR
jgi:uncharacterized integral membrane protein (TIGR00697 family)